MTNRRKKIMKPFLISVSLLALVAAGRAAPLDDQNVRRGKQHQQQEQTTTQPQRVVTPKVHTNANVNAQTNVNTPMNTHRQLTRRAVRRLDDDGNARVRGNVNAGVNASVRHFNFNNKSVVNVEKVKFRNESRIVGAERWQGQKYAAFRNYRAQWHDRNWWHHNHTRIIFVYGAPYYWDMGWWYPAWGYDPYANYYYDGPIYAYNDLPPDQVVANVQTSLQEQGYYEGEIDGVLGPLTRAAIAAYQQDHGLYVTSAIDEPTLSALGMV
jgi:hypothetical protein